MNRRTQVGPEKIPSAIERLHQRIAPPAQRGRKSPRRERVPDLRFPFLSGKGSQFGSRAGYAIADMAPYPLMLATPRLREVGVPPQSEAMARRKSAIVPPRRRGVAIRRWQTTADQRVWLNNQNDGD
jgi:hypothetical protein